MTAGSGPTPVVLFVDVDGASEPLFTTVSVSNSCWTCTPEIWGSVCEERLSGRLLYCRIVCDVAVLSGGSSRVGLDWWVRDWKSSIAFGTSK